MAYCTNCGAELSEGANFCHVCGAPVTPPKAQDGASKRQQEYAGKLIKCPNCGELIDAFVTNCPSCGYEIRGASNSAALQEFSRMLAGTRSDKEKSTVIRSFPIPNTKEDILEFLILASTNINENQNYDDEVSDAWVAKIQQAYQKAELSFKDQPEFARVQYTYDRVMETLEREANAKKANEARGALSEFAAAFPNAFIVAVWLLSLFFLEPFWRVSYYGSGVDTFRSLYMIDLFAGIFFIPVMCRCISSLPRLLAIAGLTLNVVLFLPMGVGSSSESAFSAYVGMLSTAVVLAAIIFIRLFTKRTRNYIRMRLRRPSYLFTLLCVIVCIIVYVLGIQSSSAINRANVAARDQKQMVSYEWPTSGLSQHIPMPDLEYGAIILNDDSTFRIKLYKVELDQYQNYVNECTSQGYSLYSSKSDSSYDAYNDEEYELTASYDEEESIMTLTVDAPMSMSKISWPKNDLTAQIPIPDYSAGNIKSDSAGTFNVYLSGFTQEQYEDYVDRCIAGGFTVDYYRSDSAFYGDNAAGYHLNIKTEKFDKIHLVIDAPKEKETEE